MTSLSIQFDRDGVQLVPEAEGHFVGFGDRRAGVEAGVESFVERDAVGNALFDTAFADVGEVVKVSQSSSTNHEVDERIPR